MGIDNFLTFIATALIFIITPGIDTVFILNKSILEGKRAGVYATFGINSGKLVHTSFAALGLSLIVAKSAFLFMLIKFLGAAYLVYIGIVKICSKTNLAVPVATTTPVKTDRQNYISGLVTNILNPKVALFFLAFFPQFISPASMHTPLPFFILGFSYALMGVSWFLLVTVFAAALSGRLIAHPGAGRWLNKISGSLFILMGVKIALGKR